MSAVGPIGIIANPRSGSDVRRVLAAAGPSTLEDKINVVRRVALGAKEAGTSAFVVHRDPHQIIRRATETIRDIDVDYVDLDLTFTEEDTTNAARAMADVGCAVVVVLGGDGTNRAAAKGWPGLPVLPVSTGTNNAFPEFVEATVAGAASGLLASGRIDRDGFLRRSKLIHVSVTGPGPGSTDGVVVAGDDALDPDIALIDAVAVDDPYVGSLELFQPDTMRLAVLTRADPAAMGFSAVGGVLQPLRPDEDGALLVRFTDDLDAAERVVRGPTAPGHYSDIGVSEVRRLAFGEEVAVDGELLLAFDGERKRRVHAGHTATLVVRDDGPQVVNVAAVMAEAAHQGLYLRR